MEIIVYRSKLWPLMRWRVLKPGYSGSYTRVLTDDSYRRGERIKDRWALSEAHAWSSAERFVKDYRQQQENPPAFVPPKWPKRKHV